MSGHSKWAKIKRAKGAADAKRGALFTKLAKNITLAAQEGGGDPGMNFSLRLAVDKAKQANMPQENIERAIKKGTGELKGEGSVQRITYEFVTGSGVAGLIDCSTDNTNRTFSDLKNLIETAGQKMGEAGSVSWQFKEQGSIEVGAAKLQKAQKYGEADKYVNASAEELEEQLLEVDGVLDYEITDASLDPDWEGDETRPSNRKYVSITTEKEKLASATEKLQQAGWQVLESEIAKSSDNPVTLAGADEAKLQALVEQLLDHDDVDNVWTNVA